MPYQPDESTPCCLECGDPLPYGRADRKYCSPACKNRYHNREQHHWRGRFTRVIGILQKNHDILLSLIRMGIRSIPKSELSQLGYRQDYMTSCRKEGKRMICRCFDIVFVEMENRLSNLSLETDSRLGKMGEDA